MQNKRNQRKNQNRQQRRPQRSNLPLGNASVAVGAERPKYRIVTRHVWQLNATPIISSTITNSQQAYLPVGNQFADVGLAWSLRSFYESTDPTLLTYDQFRISTIQVYAEQAFEGPGVDVIKSCFISVDHDDDNTPTWLEIQSRDNVALAVIRNNNPKQMVASFRPVAQYTVSASASAPSNAVPDNSQWFDMTAIGQFFNGLKIHYEAPGGSTTSLRFHARATMQFRGKI